MRPVRSDADCFTNLKLFMAGLEKVDPSGDLASACGIERGRFAKLADAPGAGE